jgi:hypothetical protein
MALSPRSGLVSPISPMSPIPQTSPALAAKADVDARKGSGDVLESVYPHRVASFGAETRRALPSVTVSRPSAVAEGAAFHNVVGGTFGIASVSFASVLSLFMFASVLVAFASVLSLFMFASVLALVAIVSVLSLFVFASVLTLVAFASVLSLVVFASVLTLVAFASVLSLCMFASVLALLAIVSILSLFVFASVLTLVAFASVLTLVAFDIFVKCCTWLCSCASRGIMWQ